MKKGKNSGGSAAILALGALAVAGIGAVVMMRSGTMPDYTGMLGAMPAGSGAVPDEQLQVSNVGSGKYYGPSYTQKYAEYFPGGTVVTAGGGGTLTPTYSTDRSPTDGGSSFGVKVNVGGVLGGK